MSHYETDGAARGSPVCGGSQIETRPAAALNYIGECCFKEAAINHSPPRRAPVTDTMRAFVIAEVAKTAVGERLIPQPGPNDVIVRTTAAPRRL